MKLYWYTDGIIIKTENVKAAFIAKIAEKSEVCHISSIQQEFSVFMDQELRI